MIKDLQLIITGGTIDKEWDPFIELSPPKTKTKVILRSRSGIKPYLDRVIQPDFPIYENVVSLVDSSDITDEIRQKIVAGIKSTKSENIIVSHGTDSLADFGKWLYKHIGTDKEFVKSGKKVICLGGFYPLVGGVPSDAPFNVGFAIGMMEHIKPGVYIAMNSRVFVANECEKDFEKAKFYLTKS